MNYIVPQTGLAHARELPACRWWTLQPFIARAIPSADESMVVIRFANPKGIDFQYLLNMIGLTG